VGFRPMTTFEIITCMEYQGNRFKKWVDAGDLTAETNYGNQNRIWYS
jgi:hypothetical protein